MFGRLRRWGFLRFLDSLVERVYPSKTVLSPLLWICMVTTIAACCTWTERFYWLFAGTVAATIGAFFVVLFVKDPGLLQGSGRGVAKTARRWQLWA